jgi:hypothetical protein
MSERGVGNIGATRHGLNSNALTVMLHVQLPVRKEITLSEAVTAFLYGKPRDPPSEPLYPSYALDVLLEQLQRAAGAGKVRFRALKIGKNKYQEIKTSYFRKRCHFEWRKNQIKHWASYNNPEEPDYDRALAVGWDDVHLDREQFASFLKDMGAAVQQYPDDDESDQLELRDTGLPGRPPLIHLALPIAETMLKSGDYPGTKLAFAKQIAVGVRKRYPGTRPLRPKTITNNNEFKALLRKPEFQELMRKNAPKIIVSS